MNIGCQQLTGEKKTQFSPRSAAHSTQMETGLGEGGEDRQADAQTAGGPDTSISIPVTL